MALVHLGVAALKKGLNVVHYTLELGDKVIAQRYDSCITGISLSEIINHKDQVFNAVQGIKGSLLVKEYPTKSASTATIKAHLDKLKARGHKVDFVIVDYGDLLRPVTKDREKRQELESIYEEMRGIAQIHDCCLWTASQTNRTGLNAEVITMESISEAFNKCFVADFICTISRTIKDKAANEGRMYVAKNRNGPDGIVYPLFMDTKNVAIKVLQKSDESADQIIAKSAKDQEETLRQKYKTFKKEQKSK
jgi:replicative DNA helicase